MKTKIILLTLALSTSTCLLSGQDGQPRPEGQRPPGREGGPGSQGGGPGAPGGPGGMGGQRPVMPIIEALDLNKDGTIDAEELAKANESLKKLDKNGDGKLTGDEFRPQRPGGQGGPGGPGGQRGGGRPGGDSQPQRPAVER